MESDLVPYTALTELPARRVLVLAPHPDDEVFGCGGAIARHRALGVPVEVVVLTDGARFGDPALRRQESRAAAAVLGYGEPEFWDLPDRGLVGDEALVARLAARLRDGATDLVYAPSPWEVHPDHRQAALAALEAVGRAGGAVRLACYEVGAPLRPNVLLDIGLVLERKREAMACFASQQAQQDFAGHIDGLNRYRSYTLPRAVRAAEAFLLLGAADLAGPRRRHDLFALASTGLGIAAAADTAGLPLVSVLVRSVDRGPLAQALDSVALQGYPNLEVVVAAALPGHRPLPAHCGAHRMRLLPAAQPLRRSETANRLLDAAAGELLLFLDDDDWLLPSHVQRLADALAAQPQVAAAYTGTLLVDADGTPRGQTLDLPFDPLRQLAGNLTPIHSVMFRRGLLQRGCRFDESLDRYEDWDFWLQIARQTAFAHLPGVSAAYRIHDSSGVHEDAGPMGAATALLYAKWAPSWQPDQLGRLMQRVWSHSDLEDEIARLRTQAQQAAGSAEALEQRLQAQAALLADQARALAEQGSALVQQQAALAEQAQAAARQQALVLQQQQDLAAVLGSTSWRITAPLRRAARALRRNGR